FKAKNPSEVWSNRKILGARVWMIISPIKVWVLTKPTLRHKEPLRIIAMKVVGLLSPCTLFLRDTKHNSQSEAVFVECSDHSPKSFPKKPPCIGEVVKWIASLGGFLGRKGDGEPGVMTLWRGWKRLCDLSEGWRLALA
ncbi:MAG: IS4 family transposase, partial [Cyclobacteriaceae bacterium]